MAFMILLRLTNSMRSGVRVAQSFVFCIMVYPLFLFLLAIVLSVLRFLVSNYTFGNFKLFVIHIVKMKS